MYIEETVSNRMKLEYDEEKDGETFLISTISDMGEVQLCRINLENISQIKNFVDLSLQFMSKCKQEREQKSQIATAHGRVVQ